MKTPSDGKILVVEDSAPGRELISTFLKKLGFEVLTAADGLSGIELIKQSVLPKERAIAAVMADLKMPGMDGMELLKQVRGSAAESGLRDIPFVLVTATSDQQTIVKAQELRVTGYLLKPVTFERIVWKLKEIFSGGLQWPL